MIFSILVYVILYFLSMTYILYTNISYLLFYLPSVNYNLVSLLI